MFWVDNAGFELLCPVEALSDELLTRQFDTNAFGVVRMVRAVAPEMRERKRGVIANLSSVVGWLTLAYTAAYGASKHAVSRCLRGSGSSLRPSAPARPARWRGSCSI